MTDGTSLTHEFVEFIPDDLAENRVYVSIRFATAAHKCCCGCGSKVVTPLRPTDWKLIFDGKTVSLDPSIGNWSFACRSHYWIKNNWVRWAEKWSDDEVQAGRRHDRVTKSAYFEKAAAGSENSKPSIEKPPPSEGFLRRFWKWLE